MYEITELKMLQLIEGHGPVLKPTAATTLLLASSFSRIPARLMQCFRGRGRGILRESLETNQKVRGDLHGQAPGGLQ